MREKVILLALYFIAALISDNLYSPMLASALRTRSSHLLSQSQSGPCSLLLVRPLSVSSSNTDIQQMYDKYVDAFTSGDMKTVATQYYMAPVSVSLCVRSSAVMRSVFLTPIDVEQALTFQMEGLKQRGYSGRSSMQPLKITPMTEVAKLIQTEGTRYHTSGEVLEKVRASYQVERIDDGRDDSPTGGAGKWFITSVHADITPVMEF